MFGLAMLFEEDCTILLERALLGRSVCAFGEDGFGKHGRHERASWYTVKSLDITVSCEEDADDPIEAEGVVSLTLEGYDSTVTGHIMTDKNFELSVREHLKKVGIDEKSLEWPDDLEFQGDNFVTFHINLELLLA